MQPKKAYSSISSSPSFNLTSERELHPQNAPSPSFFKLEGAINCFNEEQPPNALSPISSNPSLKLISTMLLHT